MLPTHTEAYVEGRIRIPYKWPAGRIGSVFLRTLRDERRFVGVRCERCRLVYCPPKAHCVRCNQATETLVDVGPRGTVIAASNGLGLILLDGADTALVHRVETMESGTIVEPSWRAERSGSILDVEGFKPVGRGTVVERYGIGYRPAGAAPRIPPGVRILGVASIAPGADRRAASFAEMAHEVVQALYSQLGVDDSMIDTVVTSSSDFLDGRTISDMAVQDVVGAPGRSASKVSMDGLFGLLYAAARIGSGMFHTCLVVAHSKASEGEPRLISQAAFDPIFVRPLEITDHDVLRLQAQRWHDVQSHTFHADAERIAPDSDGAVALLLADEATARRIGKPHLELAGAGFASHVPAFSERDLADVGALTYAVRQACESAAVKLTDVTRAETTALSTTQLEMHRDAMGLPAEAASLSHNPGFATGLYGLAAVWRDEAPLSLVHASAGYVGQNHAVWICRRVAS